MISVAQFYEDVSHTPLGSGAIPSGNCQCLSNGGPCCRSGACQWNCYVLSDTLPACADAGGVCIVLPMEADCGPRGHPDLCAYADEEC
jgi:hypothetical protein